MSKKVVFKQTKDNESLTALGMAFLSECMQDKLTNDDILSVLAVLIRFVSKFKEIDEGYDNGVVYKATVNVFLESFEEVTKNEAELCRRFILKNLSEKTKG